MGITESLHIVAIKVSIRDVLKKCLQLTKIDLSDHFLDICVHDGAPVDAALARLEIELGR